MYHYIFPLIVVPIIVYQQIVIKNPKLTIAQLFPIDESAFRLPQLIIASDYTVYVRILFDRLLLE